MAVIKINSFGGEIPSASALALPPGAARVSQNLLATSNEFRPLLGEEVVFSLLTNSDPKTIWHGSHNAASEAPSINEGWLSQAEVISTAKWPSGDNTTERMTLTIEGGSLAPRVYENNSTASVKLLGVPAPSAAPSLAHNKTPEYTVDEDTAARIRIPAEYVAVFQKAGVPDKVGIADPSSYSVGSESRWVAHNETVTGKSGAKITQANGDYAFLVPMVAKAPKYPVTDGYLLDTNFGGKGVIYTSNSSITIAPTLDSATHWAVNVTLNGFGWTLDKNLFLAEAKKVKHPDPDTVRDLGLYDYDDQLFSNSDLNTIADNAVAMYTRSNVTVSGSILALENASNALIQAVTNVTNQTALAATITAFYKVGTPVYTEIIAAVVNFDVGLVSAANGLVAGKTGTSPSATGNYLTESLFNSTYKKIATDGSIYLDKEALRLDTKGRMASRMQSEPALIAQLDNIIANALNQLDSIVNVNHWNTRSDWPTSATVLDAANGARATNVYSALLTLRAAAQGVTAAYDALNAKTAASLAEAATALFSTSGGLGVPVTRLIESRFYVMTWVTNWGEESAPSAPTALLEMDQNDTVTVTRTPTVPSGYGIDTWRIYRSNVGSNTAEFQFVKEVVAGITAFTDDLKSAELGEVLPTTTWLTPPSNLQGITNMANGVQAGFFATTLCFCEPFVPYAWPIEYQITVRNPIVGMAAFGQNLFVGTHGAPYIVSGADSASMSVLELASSQSCVSSRSIVAVENGALYASPDGLCMASAGGVEVVTQGLFSREDWQAINPSSVVAALHDGVYYFLWNNLLAGTKGCYALDFVAKKLVRVDTTGSTLYSDKINDTLCIASGTMVKSMFTGARRTGLYRTGIINIGMQQPLAWLQVDSDFTAPVTVRWYGDGAKQYEVAISSRTPVRLPSGRYLEHEVEIESAARVTSVTLAGSTQELQAA